jgi:hypothetical protein
MFCVGAFKKHSAIGNGEGDTKFTESTPGDHFTVIDLNI